MAAARQLPGCLACGLFCILHKTASVLFMLVRLLSAVVHCDSCAAYMSAGSFLSSAHVYCVVIRFCHLDCCRVCTTSILLLGLLRWSSCNVSVFPEQPLLANLLYAYILHCAQGAGQLACACNVSVPSSFAGLHILVSIAAQRAIVDNHIRHHLIWRYDNRCHLYSPSTSLYALCL